MRSGGLAIVCAMQDIGYAIPAMRSGFLAIVCAMQDIEYPILAMRSGVWQLCVLCRTLSVRF